MQAPKVETCLFLFMHVCENTVQEWSCMTILNVCEKVLGKQDVNLVTSVSSNTELYFEWFLLFHPGVNLLQLLLLTCLYGNTCFCHVWLVHLL